MSREAKDDETLNETRSLFYYYNLRRVAVLYAVRVIASPLVSYYNESNLVVGIKKQSPSNILWRQISFSSPNMPDSHSYHFSNYYSCR